MLTACVATAIVVGLIAYRVGWVRCEVAAEVRAEKARRRAAAAVNARDSTVEAIGRERAKHWSLN